MSLTPIAAAVKHLIAAGVTGDALVTAIADIEVSLNPVKERSPGAERMRRYRQRGGGKISLPLRMEVLHRDNFTCVYCGSDQNLHCDHVVPVSKGGETSLYNLVTACRPCNSSKRDKNLKEWRPA